MRYFSPTANQSLEKTFFLKMKKVPEEIQSEEQEIKVTVLVLGVQHPAIRLTIVTPNRSDGVSTANTICKDAPFKDRIELDRICEVMRLYADPEAYRLFFVQLIGHLTRSGIVFPKSN